MKTTVLVGGIPPGSGGTAVVMAYIRSRVEESPQRRMILRFEPHISLRSIGERLRAREPGAALELTWRRAAVGVRKALTRDEIGRADHLILVHPQTLGYKSFLEYAARGVRRTWLYLMDCSFFCIRSYNHIPGESAPCLRCLGGHFENIGRHGCTPHPLADEEAVRYVRRLMDFVREGRVRLLAQHALQAELALRHFGRQAAVKTIGVWADDWTPPQAPDAGEGLPARKKHNVVFHGHNLQAKGSSWSMALARECTDLTFFFPFSGGPPQRNCTFAEVFWDTGLGDEVRSADVVLVPSLWSAPIEGSLIKSLVYARAVAVVDNPTAFSSTVPDDIILRLPRDVEGAAAVLHDAVAGGWTPDKTKLKEWLLDLHEHNRDFAGRLLELA